MKIDLQSIKISEENNDQLHPCINNLHTCITKVVIKVDHLEIISRSELHQRNDEDNISGIIDELSSLIPKLYDMNYSIDRWDKVIEFDQPNEISVNFFGMDKLIECIHEVLQENYFENYPY